MGSPGCWPQASLWAWCHTLQQTPSPKQIRCSNPPHSAIPAFCQTPSTHPPPPSFAVWTPSLCCGGCSRQLQTSTLCLLSSVPQALFLLCCLSSYVAPGAQTREWGLLSATRDPSALWRAVALGWQPPDGRNPSDAWAQGSEWVTPPPGVGGCVSHFADHGKHHRATITTPGARNMGVRMGSRA